MEARSGVTITLEGVPGDFIRNKNIAGDPTKSSRGWSTRSFTMRLTQEYLEALVNAGFPIKYPQTQLNQQPDHEPTPYIAVVLFAEKKYDYMPATVICDNGKTQKILNPDAWVEFDRSPIERVDMQLLTYKNTKGNICIKCEVLYFKTKQSMLFEKYAHLLDPDVEPAPFG